MSALRPAWGDVTVISLGTLSFFGATASRRRGGVVALLAATRAGRDRPASVRHCFPVVTADQAHQARTAHQPQEYDLHEEKIDRADAPQVTLSAEASKNPVGWESRLERAQAGLTASPGLSFQVPHTATVPRPVVSMIVSNVASRRRRNSAEDRLSRDGRYRDRTSDLLLVRQALSQLS
jgi:hypothetical protein